MTGTLEVRGLFVNEKRISVLLNILDDTSNQANQCRWCHNHVPTEQAHGAYSGVSEPQYILPMTQSHHCWLVNLLLDPLGCDPVSTHLFGFPRVSVRDVYKACQIIIKKIYCTIHNEERAPPLCIVHHASEYPGYTLRPITTHQTCTCVAKYA